MCASAQYMTYTSINLWITHSTCSYNPFTLIHSALSLRSLVTLTLFSLVRPNRLAALCTGLVWCRAFHYTGQLELLGNACGKAGREVRWNRWTIMKIGTFGTWGERAQRSPWISVGVFFFFFSFWETSQHRATHDLIDSRSSTNALTPKWLIKTVGNYLAQGKSHKDVFIQLWMPYKLDTHTFV